MKTLLYFNYSFVFNLTIIAPTTTKITFEVITSDSNDVYIVGKFTQLGNWNPMKIKLTIKV
jgi:hypothetical protein